MRHPVTLRRAHSGREVVLQPLAHLGPRLARNGEQLRLVIVGQRAREIGVLTCNHIPVRWSATTAQFDIGDREPLCQFLRSMAQPFAIARIAGQHSAANAETARYHRSPEQWRMHPRQRQPSAEARPAFEHETERIVARSTRDGLQPQRTVEDAAAQLFDECLDPRNVPRVVKIDLPDGVGVAQRRVHAAQSRLRGFSRAASASIRPQAKSPSRSDSLPAMRERLV